MYWFDFGYYDETRFLGASCHEKYQVRCLIMRRPGWVLKTKTKCFSATLCTDVVVGTEIVIESTVEHIDENYCILKCVIRVKGQDTLVAFGTHDKVSMNLERLGDKLKLLNMTSNYRKNLSNSKL